MSEPSANRAPTRPLHICPGCGSPLVQPTCWEQAEGRGCWRVWRRCPECEWSSEGVHDEIAIDAYDEQLDLGAQELADELQALEQSNMAEMVESFSIGLDADLIGPDDFG